MSHDISQPAPQGSIRAQDAENSRMGENSIKCGRDGQIYVSDIIVRGFIIDSETGALEEIQV